LSPDGVWQFQIYVPAYMRHMFGGKRLYRKSTGTRDIYKARHFRNHMLVEWNNLKEQFKPDTEDRRIQLAITSLHSQIRKNKNKPLIEERASSIPHLCLLRDEYATAYRDRRSLSTLSKSARAVEVFLQSIGKVDISLDQIGRRLVTDFIEEQQKRDVAGQTLQNWLTSLGSLYEFAKRRYDAIAPLNPFHGMNLEARRTIESYQPFEWHQLSTLLNEADEELRAVILIGLFSGARLDEIASLKKSDVVIVEGIQTFFISKS
ncbi:integrase, partial [Citrobacter freundii]